MPWENWKLWHTNQSVKSKKKKKKKKITIGGGGPQAAWGAAAALAVMERMEESNDDNESIRISSNETVSDLPSSSIPHPLKQKVAFLGPVGNANGLVPDIQEGLEEILGPAVETIELVVEPSLQTPTIQLWHDEQQDIQWKPLNDCWGSKGADALWRNRPSAEDILQVLDCDNDNDDRNAPGEDPSSVMTIMISNLHLIMEMGVSAAGGGQDSDFLLDEDLMSRVSHLSIEPIAFPAEEEEDDDGNDDDDNDETDGSSLRILAIPHQDVVSSQERLRPHSSIINMIVPDSHLVEAWIKSGYLQETCRTTNSTTEVVGRFGPTGSRVYDTSGCGAGGAAATISSSMNHQSEVNYINVPTASLETPNGKPINPTGAGNAYSAAISTCRSRGWSLEESACLATAIGATVCEYEHLPPWNWNVLDRIQRGTLEVYNKVISSTNITTE
mmetsp:Transcript_31198/g.75049  ORF Transcript_31198/g.75049 Transcript_31198/m.75049 type:complete len:443 (-) Transcript_31198:6-1334(-)